MKAILNIRKRSSLLMHGSEWRSIPLFENSAEACGSSWIQTKLFSISKGKKINIWSDQSLLISLCGRHSLDQSARSLQWCINMNIYCSSGWAGINKQSWPLKWEKTGCTGTKPISTKSGSRETDGGPRWKGWAGMDSLMPSGVPWVKYCVSWPSDLGGIYC